MDEINEVKMEVTTPVKMPDPATESGNYVVVIEHPNGNRENYIVVNGTVQIGLLDQGSFMVR